MTAPRVPLFQRKGPPKPAGGVMIAIHPGDGAASSNVGSDGPGGDGQEATDTPKDVTCPKCGCEFDAETGEVKNAGKYGGGDQGPTGGDMGGLKAALAGLGGGGGQP